MTITEIKPRAGKHTGELYRICLRERENRQMSVRILITARELSCRDP